MALPETFNEGSCRATRNIKTVNKNREGTSPTEKAIPSGKIVHHHRLRSRCTLIARHVVIGLE
jgi:hypothetical protein